MDPAANGVVTEKKETLNAVEEVAVKRKAEVTNGVEKKRRKEVENDAGDDDSGEKNGDGNVTDVVSFNWKSAIKQNLKSQPDGGLKLKKLRKLVVKQFLASLTDTESLPTLTEATAIFQEKLEKLQKCKRLTIEDKTVKLETRSE